jgi:hypothetical protein
MTHSPGIAWVSNLRRLVFAGIAIATAGVAITTVVPAERASADPAGSAPVAGPLLEGGAIGTLADIQLGPAGRFEFSEPAVVTPPTGGSLHASLGQVTFGGLPPFYPPAIIIGKSDVKTNGKIQLGGMTGRVSVTSSARVDGLTLGPIALDRISSRCTATDPTPSAKRDVDASAKVDGTIGGHQVKGAVAPNTVITIAQRSAAKSAEGEAALTVVLNEQVGGQSADGHPGILVNAVHVYVGSRPTSYTTDGAIFAESRCEVGLVPIPPGGVVPESPLAALLPISAVGIGGAVLVMRRHRRRRGS